MKVKYYIFSLLSALIFCSSYGQNFSNIQFVENKGQWDRSIRFQADVPAGQVYIHNTGLTIVQHDTSDWGRLYETVLRHGAGKSPATISQGFSLRSHSYRMSFLNAAANPQIIPDKPLPSYNNYLIGNDPSKWASFCKTYLGITVKDLYPNVDVRYYTQNGHVKYDLIIKPGADLSKIALKYEGVANLKVVNKELSIPTSVGTLRELAPYSYQYDQQGRKEVMCRFAVRDNIVRFNVRDYDPASILVIDPTLIFCSLSGSTVDNWGFTATYGPDGSLYGGGIVFGTGFPVSPGAFQTKFGGSAGTNYDMGIIKLSPDGSSRVYATYIGGSNADQPHSLFVDPQGNLVIAGRSSSPDYPRTSDAQSGSGWDIVVTKLNATGSALIGSRKIGGAQDDGVNMRAGRDGVISLQQNYGDDGRSEVILDGGGNVYVASCTQSKDFPVVGGFQGSFGGGSQDGVVLKFNPDLSTLLFSSFLGGNGDDAAYVLSLNPMNNNLYVAGGTTSTDLRGVGSSVYASNQGGIDGFVTMITSSGSAIIKTTYLGTGGTDQVYGVQFDKFGFPYVMGQTTSGKWPVLNVAWSQAGGQQFIAKLQPDLSAFVYSTTFGTGGGAPNISPVAFLVDRCENVYVSGWGGTVVGNRYPSEGTTGLPVTADAIKANTDGKDFYFFVLKKNGADQLYGSFFGQEGFATDHVDGGTSRFDRNGVIYQAICANCKQLNEGHDVPYPTTPGAWAEKNPSESGCNLGMVKIEMDFSGVKAAPQSSIMGVPRDTAGCVPLTVDFTDTLRTALQYIWNFGDGSPEVTTIYPNVKTSHTYNSVGIFHVRLITVDSSTCNISDTAYLNIKVGNLQATPNFSASKISRCDETVFRYRFDNLTPAPAGITFGPNAFEWDFGDGSPHQFAGGNSVNHTYAAAGTYNVKLTLLDTNFCNAPETFQKTLRIAVNVKAQFETPPNGCVPYQAQFTNVSQAGQQFFWNFGDGATSTEESPSHLYTSPGTYTVTLLAIDTTTCNVRDSVQKTLIMAIKPTAAFRAAPQPPSVNTPIVFTNSSSADAVRFKWFFGDGDTLQVNSFDPVSHEYNATGTFNACLVAFNSVGCSDTVCHPVEALIDAAVDVPNAFTPLAGGINSKVMVRGFGITKMHFVIWNRWGQKVFESENKRNGWDGRYKGTMQPMDVYAYTLEVEFFDGKKVFRKGDITLIR